MSDILWTFERVTLPGGANPRLDDVSLAIHPGVTAIVGYSGAGKTSLINLLVGFEQPVAGKLVSSLPDEPGRLPLFWVPQNFGLWPHLTALEHLHAVMPEDAKPQDAADLLAQFNLQQQADSLPSKMSVGEQSRLSVARALASRSAVLVMDEPLAHVDPARGIHYWEIIRNHVDQNSASLVIATHSPETVLLETDRAICIKAGHILYDGSVDDLYYRPQSPELASFLGPANWISSQDAAEWLNDGEYGDRCYRPEQIVITESPEGPLIVREARFAGSVGEVELQNEQTKRRRRFLHRPTGNHLKPGARVFLKACLALAACLLLFGCDTPAEPELAIQNVHNWAIPPEGKSIPAPRSVAVGRDHVIYVLDTAGRVLVFDQEGKYLRHWMMPEYDVGNPEGIRELKDGRIAVADTHYCRVVLFDSSGEVLSKFGEKGTGPGQFLYPVDIAEDDAGNLYVGEYGSNDRIQKFTAEGEFLLQFGTWGTGPGQFDRLSGLVWHDGMIYAVDATTNRIQVFSESGELMDSGELPQLHAPLLYPYGIAKSAEGELFVVEYGAGRISRFALDGTLLGRFGTTGFGKGQFSTPWGLAVLPDSRIIVADTGNRRLVELQP